MQKKGRGDMIPPTNSELKHQQALRVAQADPSVARASTGHPTDLAGDSPALEQGMPAQLRPSQDCTSQCATKRPPPGAHAGSPMAVTVAPQHRSPEVGLAGAAATPRAAAALPAAAMPQPSPMSPGAMQAHSRQPHVMCSMPYADSCGAQPGLPQWAIAGPYAQAAPPDSGGHPGGVYVVRPLAEAPAKAAAPMQEKEAPTEKLPEIGQPGLVSSLLEHETASGPRPAAGQGRTRSKPAVDYASIYKFLATCFDLSHTWQDLLAGLTQMPNKERQMTVTLMGRMLSQMESRMQHNRGTAPPGWSDLHDAAKESDAPKGAAVDPPQPEEPAAPEPAAAKASLPQTPRKPAPGGTAATGSASQQPAAQPPQGGLSDDRARAQRHTPSEPAQPSPVDAPDAAMQACMWVQSGAPGISSDPGNDDRPWPGARPRALHMHACQQRSGAAPKVASGSTHSACAADAPPLMAAVGITAAQQPPARQRSPLRPVAGMPCDAPMADPPPAGYPVQGGTTGSLPDTLRTGRARAAAVAAPEQPAQEPMQPGCASQRQPGMSVPQPQVLGTPAAGDMRTMSFCSLMPAMHGPQSLAARSAFDARFDARMATAAMHGPRMADVQVHGSRPAAQQMIPTPVLPPEAQAEMDGRKANGSSGAEDTAGPPLAASATAADYLMGAVVPPSLDSCMEVDGDEPLRPPVPPPGLRRPPGGMMWMPGPECGDALPQSAGHSATACATDSAWTAVGNSREEPSMAMGYAWQPGWPGGPPLSMDVGPGMHMPPHVMMQRQQMQRDDIGDLLMADDADVALMGGSDMAMEMCMPHMHEDPMGQPPGMGVPAMSISGGQGQMVQGHAGKPVRCYRAVSGGQDAAGNPVHKLAGVVAQRDWMQEQRPRQQRVPPWAAGPPAV